MKKKYVLVGASGRSRNMFARPIVEDFAHCAEIVGVFDVNPLRCELIKRKLNLDCKVYTDFDTMIAETKPDVGIVTTVDRFHHEYICRLLEAGIDAITEKPMTIDADKCNQILETEKRTGRKVIVTFNYRFAPFTTAIKQAIVDGMVGEVLSVNMEYLLDTNHGASYFQRWHRYIENSGSLLVHKATHHFDLINWWINDEPEEVFAFGVRRFYGNTREECGERCLTCNHKKTCEFYDDITADEFSRETYLECEKVDGYFCDKCKFGDDINIYDTMSVNVKYKGGPILTYSLIAHSPYEGFKVSISGTKGRLEAEEYHSGVQANDPAYYFNIFDRKGQKIGYTVPKSNGGHGGGDERLQKMIIEGGIPDPLNHQAGTYAGAISIMIGVSAVESIKKGKNIKIKDLVPFDKYFG
jgi:predicted dehydrogenase